MRARALNLLHVVHAMMGKVECPLGQFFESIRNFFLSDREGGRKREDRTLRPVSEEEESFFEEVSQEWAGRIFQFETPHHAPAPERENFWVLELA